MIKVAMVQSDGQVAYTISPAVDDMYVDGQEYSGCVARHISHESNDQDVINTWYWNNGWQTRGSQPSVYHEWVDSAWAFSGALFWQDVRGSRDIKLYSCDWTQMLDAQLTDAKKAEWATYRQALRDMPETHSEATSLDDIMWPTEPR